MAKVNEIVIATGIIKSWFFIQAVQDHSVNSDVCCEKGNHGNCLITNNTGHSNLHSKEGPTKTLRLRHHKPFCTTSKSHQEYIRCTYLCKKKQKEARELNDSAENSSSVIKMHI